MTKFLCRPASATPAPCLVVSDAEIKIPGAIAKLDGMAMLKTIAPDRTNRSKNGAVVLGVEPAICASGKSLTL